MYAPEYNRPEFHDRVLVFDVMRDGWEAIADQTRLCEVKVACREADSEKSSENRSTSFEVVSQLECNEPNNEPKALNAFLCEEKYTVEEQASSASETESKQESACCKESKGTSADKQSSDSASDNTQDNAISSSALSTENAMRPRNNWLRQHKIFVHSSWLAVQSKYFRSLFLSEMKISNSKEVHIKISESEEDTHLKMLEAMYKADILNNASVEELLAVLELADKYDVKFVFRKCKYVLQTRAITLDICKTIMHVIKVKHDMVDVEDLAGTMQITLGKCYSPLEKHWQTERFTSLSEPCVKSLLSSNELSTQCENTVFQALMYWMENNKVDPSSIEPSSTLLDAVRFDLTTIDYLYNVIRVHPIATKMPHFQVLLLKGMTYHALPTGLRNRLGQITPVARKENAEQIVQHTWVIRSNNLPSTPRSKLTSEEFWCSGYKAKLEFQKRESGSGYYYALLTFRLQELTYYNYVPLTWTVTSYGFVEEKVTDSHNFSLSYPSHCTKVTLKRINRQTFSFGETLFIDIAVRQN